MGDGNFRHSPADEPGNRHINAMLAEITRWHQWPEPPANRWQRWAAQLRQRYSLVQVFGLAPSFYFLQTRGLRLGTMRPSMLKWTFAPHWHLVIRPFFQQKESIEPLPSVMEGQWQNQGGKQNKTVVEYTKKSIEPVMNRANEWTSLAQVEVRKSVISPAAVNLIFQHLPFRLMSVHYEELVRRIRREKQRVESSVGGMAVRQYRPVTTWIEMGQTTGRSMPSSSLHANEFAPNATSAQPPQWNIAELTDQVIRQIDQKLIAYRERMGKLF